MSDYTIQVSWSGKDALADSNPNKIISGADFNTEFGAVQTAVNSKYDSADLGVTLQQYDADTAKTDTAQTFTASQRGTITTDNDLSFDQNATNNFNCKDRAFSFAGSNGSGCFGGGFRIASNCFVPSAS